MYSAHPIRPLLPLMARCGEKVTLCVLFILSAGVVLLLSVPVLILTIAAVIALKIEHPHLPLLFRQRRLGFNREEFEILKFRTMLPNSQVVTRVGFYLRISHVDELPQLINILKGDMRFVGPRPLTKEDCERLGGSEHFARRFKLPPGLVGPEQVLGRTKQQERTVGCSILLFRQLHDASELNRMKLNFIYGYQALLCVCKLQGSST
ncbi:MAG: sugar transferase [Patescibacteria group bacterium]